MASFPSESGLVAAEKRVRDGGVYQNNRFPLRCCMRMKHPRNFDKGRGGGEVGAVSLIAISICALSVVLGWRLVRRLPKGLTFQLKLAREDFGDYQVKCLPCPCAFYSSRGRDASKPHFSQLFLRAD